MEIGQEIVDHNTKRLDSLLYFLSDKDIDDIIETYKYQEKIEIMPDIVMGINLLKYEQGEYKIQYRMNEYVKTVIMLEKSIIFVGFYAIFLLVDSTLIELYRLDTTSRVFKYDEMSLLCYVKNTNGVILLTFDATTNKMTSKQFKTGISISNNSYMYQDKYIIDLDNEIIYELDLENMQIKASKKSIEQKYKIVYTGRYNPLLLIAGNKTYIYDYVNRGNSPLSATREIDLVIKGTSNNIPIRDGFRLGNKLYEYIDGEVVDMNVNVSDVKVALTNDLYIDNKSNLIKGERNMGKIKDNLSILPSSIHVSKYVKLIPDMVNHNIKNLIINFCRSDKFYSNYIKTN